MIARLSDHDGKRESFLVDVFKIPPVYLMRLGRLWVYRDHAALPNPASGHVTAFYQPSSVYDISHLYPLED